MVAVQVANDVLNEDVLDQIIALQIMVAWAGEGACEPKRLDWWRTDLIDEDGGGDLFVRLLPKTHKWASLEAVRQAAIQVDRCKREEMAQPDGIRTLFFWGYDIDEQLSDRAAFHKSSGEEPLAVLSDICLDIYKSFSSEEFQQAIQLLNPGVDFRVVPNGREIMGDIQPQNWLENAKKLTAALLPLAEGYPMPFYRLKKS